VLEADKVINLPIAKHHNATRLTMGLKNVMGVVAQSGQHSSRSGQHHRGPQPS